MNHYSMIHLKLIYYKQFLTIINRWLHNFTIFSLFCSYLSEKQHKRMHEFAPDLHEIPDIISPEVLSLAILEISCLVGEGTLKI